MVTPAVRQRVAPAVKTPSAASPWENRPRDGFTASMGARVDEMQRSRQSTFVKGLPDD